MRWYCVAGMRTIGTRSIRESERVDVVFFGEAAQSPGGEKLVGVQNPLQHPPQLSVIDEGEKVVMPSILVA